MKAHFRPALTILVGVVLGIILMLSGPQSTSSSAKVKIVEAWFRDCNAGTLIGCNALLSHNIAIKVPPPKGQIEDVRCRYQPQQSIVVCTFKSAFDGGGISKGRHYWRFDVVHLKSRWVIVSYGRG